MGKLLALAVIGVIGVFVSRELPSVRRYLTIERM